MADEALWTTKEIITLVVGTGAISAVASSILSWVGDLVRSVSRSKRDRTYLCMRIASILDAYAIKCAELIDASEAHYGQTRIPPNLNLPEPPAYPEDVEWRSLNQETAYQLMSFLNEYEARAAGARYAEQFEGNPFDFEDAARSTGKKAYELANVLRSVANLTVPDLDRALSSLLKGK